VVLEACNRKERSRLGECKARQGFVFFVFFVSSLHACNLFRSWRCTRQDKSKTRRVHGAIPQRSSRVTSHGAPASSSRRITPLPPPPPSLPPSLLPSLPPSLPPSLQCSAFPTTPRGVGPAHDSVAAETQHWRTNLIARMTQGGQPPPAPYMLQRRPCRVVVIAIYRQPAQQFSSKAAP